ncbi:hypothetical protein LWI28_024385 [Acer negundo]|uniref:Uncharacterized protein n=1 Tax=Acer negundo TaxID=4023 RepID=A0AAD5NYC3_ACENE|nr:hypothetical protein LWI28_024385 [Acer negundo]
MNIASTLSSNDNLKLVRHHRRVFLCHLRDCMQQRHTPHLSELIYIVPEMAEEDFSVVEDKLEIVGGGESGVHEADQQQRHAISAVEYVNSYV